MPTTDFGRSKFRQKIAEVERQEVSVCRLDGLWNEVTKGLDDPRVYLKMDTQGYDLEVFAGAGRCIERVRALQSELSVLQLYEGMPDYQAALQEYRRSGFEVSGFFHVFGDRQTGLLGEFDCVMIRTRPA